MDSFSVVKMALTVYKTHNCCADHLGIEVAWLSGLQSPENRLVLIEVNTCFDLI